MAIVDSGTECQLTATGIAIKRFQLASKRLPSELKELVPTYINTVPTDPFNNDQPIKYVTSEDGNGFKLYSVARDIVFSVGMPETIDVDTENESGDDDNE